MGMEDEISPPVVTPPLKRGRRKEHSPTQEVMHNRIPIRGNSEDDTTSTSTALCAAVVPEATLAPQPLVDKSDTESQSSSKSSVSIDRIQAALRQKRLEEQLAREQAKMLETKLELEKAKSSSRSNSSRSRSRKVKSFYPWFP